VIALAPRHPLSASSARPSGTPSQTLVTTIAAGAVKGGPTGRPEGTEATRRPLTAPVTQNPTIRIVPPDRAGPTCPCPRRHVRLK
jgi:hypothetical protein